MTSLPVTDVYTSTHYLNTSSTLYPSFYLNHTHSPGIVGNDTGTRNTTPPYDAGSGYGLGTTVTVAIALGSAAFVIIAVIVVICLIRKKHHKKTKAWVDNLTLSYIADSNIDLTKDTNDEMISLDNDNFLNSLDTHSFSVFSPDSNTRQYTYSYF